MKYYPVMLNIEGRLAVVIGGGDVARRKCAELIEAGASVKVVSPDIVQEIDEMSRASRRVEVFRRSYSRGDLKGAAIAVSATDNPAVNREVFLEAQGLGIFINAVDDPPNCSFIVPSIIRRGDLVVAVSTSGASPSIAAKIRGSIESIIPDDIEITLAAFRRAREILKSEPVFAHLDFISRGRIIKKISGDDSLIGELSESYKSDTLVEFLADISNRRI